MIALYLLAAHMVGDYVLQTRWQAAGKLIDARLRARHVAAYCLPFVPIAVYYSGDWAGACLFMWWLFALHFVTDSRRFHATLGDAIVWRARRREGELGASPWPPLPILIDQTLHVCQLALLGGLFLT